MLVTDEDSLGYGEMTPRASSWSAAYQLVKRSSKKRQLTPATIVISKCSERRVERIEQCIFVVALGMFVKEGACIDETVRCGDMSIGWL